MTKVTIDLTDLVELQAQAATKMSDHFDKMVDTNTSIKKAVKQFARAYIEAALKDSNGSKTKAAKKVGLSYPTFLNWYNRYMKD